MISKRTIHEQKSHSASFTPLDTPATGNVRKHSEHVTATVPLLFMTHTAAWVGLLRSKIKTREATLDVQCDRNLEITAVHGELRQVFSNLVANSLDALGEDGRVTIRASSSPYALQGMARVRITVSDNGKGIDREALSEIFEPFFTTKGTIGNGLGLWVTKQIVEKHGGTIRVRSQTHGKQRGTTFSITLPKGGI